METKTFRLTELLFRSITVRCASDHPQQTLYQLLALANAYADDPVTHKKTKEPRVLGAVKILEKLKKEQKLMNVVVQMEKMCSSKSLTNNSIGMAFELIFSYSTNHTG